MHIIKFFLDPFNLFWLLLIIALAAYLLRKKQLFKRLIITAGVWFLIISTPLLPNLLLYSLESRFEPIRVKEELTDFEAEYHIVVLGGGHGIDEGLPANAQLSPDALGRLNEGIRLHRYLPNSKLVLSGYSASGGATQAEILQETAFLLGVDKEATILQKEPGNTYEEAQVYMKKHGGDNPVILVASASQMPRAVHIFRHFGADPVPSPANYRIKGRPNPVLFGFPAIEYMVNFRIGIYEYAGMFWYFLRS